LNKTQTLFAYPYILTRDYYDPYIKSLLALQP
jgi:hypothetical protein